MSEFNAPLFISILKRMDKIRQMSILLLLILMPLIHLSAQTQTEKYFVITGKIVPEEGKMGTGIIEVIKDKRDTSIIDIPKNNTFRLELEFFNNYVLTFKYPGHFNRILLVSTQIPQDVWERDSDFPPFPMVVELMKEIEGIDKSFALKPTGKIFYRKNIDKFTSKPLNN
jgi:hypothetical protein